MRLVTAEYIGRGHPDKLADQISDAVVQWHKNIDSKSHCAVETMVKDDTVVLAGEINSEAYMDKETARQIVKEILRQVGYEKDYNGLDSNHFNIVFLLNNQSPDIDQAVKDGQEEQGAGDQGIVIGAATDETEERMPLAYVIAYRLIKAYESLLPHQAHVKGDNTLPWAKADCKSQVTLEYDEHGTGDGQLTKIDTIVMSVQHDEKVSIEQIREDIKTKVIQPVLAALMLDGLLDEARLLINPSGRFIIGGPKGDCGLTGRKIIADTYGSYYRHGGGAFSGKDLSKTDRSGAYYARMIARQIVDNNIAESAEVEIAFAIGYPRPVSVRINATGINGEDALETIKKEILQTSIKELVELVEENIKVKGLTYIDLAISGVVRL